MYGSKWHSLKRATSLFTEDGEMLEALGVCFVSLTEDRSDVSDALLLLVWAQTGSPISVAN